DAVAGRNSFQAVQRRSLSQTPAYFVGDVGPKGILIFAYDAAVQDDAPSLLFGRRETQALEWNRYPHYVAAAGCLPPRVPHGVERNVEIPVGFFTGGLGPNGVPLHPERSGLKRVGASAVVKSVEHDFDIVVVVDVLAARHTAADFLGIIETDEYNVETLPVVSQIG